jgi:hypothetical protein
MVSQQLPFMDIRFPNSLSDIPRKPDKSLKYEKIDVPIMLRPESRTEGVKNKEYLLSLERRGRHGEKPEDVSGVIQEAGGDRGAGKQEDSSGNRF